MGGMSGGPKPVTAPNPAAGLKASEKELTFTKSELSGKCEDCGQPVSYCACFRVLSKPEIKKSENGNVTLKLKSDWDQESVSALYFSIKRRKVE